MSPWFGISYWTAHSHTDEASAQTVNLHPHEPFAESCSDMIFRVTAQCERKTRWFRSKKGRHYLLGNSTKVFMGKDVEEGDMQMDRAKKSCMAEK